MNENELAGAPAPEPEATTDPRSVKSMSTSEWIEQILLVVTHTFYLKGVE